MNKSILTEVKKSIRDNVEAERLAAEFEKYSLTRNYIQSKMLYSVLVGVLSGGLIYSISKVFDIGASNINGPITVGIMGTATGLTLALFEKIRIKIYIKNYHNEQ